MSETTMHNFDERLDHAIDALNREASPAPHERGDRELFSLVDAARLIKSLCDPAEPEPGFESQAVNRITGEMGRLPATSNNGIPPASAPAVRPLDSVGAGTSKSPGRVRARLSEMSELAAVLLVIFVVVGAVALSQTVFSGDNGRSPAGAANTPTTLTEPQSTPTPTVTPVDDGIASILKRFQETQAAVDFELAMPAQLDGFELQENALNVSGPPAAPAVNATFIDNNSSPPRMLGFAQRPGGFGDLPSREGDEAVPTTIQGIETTLYRQSQDGELPILRVRWEMNGVHYDVGATNVEEETLLEIVNSIALLSEIDVTGEAVSLAPGTTLPTQDPVEFVLEYLQAMEERDMDAVRSMLVEPFRQFDDDLLAQVSYLPVPPDAAQGPAAWTAEHNQHFTVVRHNELPLIAYVLRPGESGTWGIDPGPANYWWAQQMASHEIGDSYQIVVSVDKERITAFDTSLISETINLVEVTDNTVEVSIQWQFLLGRSGDIPLEGLSWSSGDLRGDVEVIWTTARLTEDSLIFPGFPPENDRGGASYFATLTLFDVPESHDFQLHVDDATVIDENGDALTFSTTFHFLPESYPWFRLESDP